MNQPNLPNMQDFQNFVKDPRAYFLKVGLEIPQELTTPDQMIQYCLQTNKISQNDFNNFYVQARQMQANGFGQQR